MPRTLVLVTASVLAVTALVGCSSTDTRETAVEQTTEPSDPSATDTASAPEGDLCAAAPDFATVVSVTGFADLDETPTQDDAGTCAYGDPTDPARVVTFNKTDGDTVAVARSINGYPASTAVPGAIQGPHQLLVAHSGSTYTITVIGGTNSSEATAGTAVVALAKAWGLT